VRSRDPLWEDRLATAERSSVREGPTLAEGRETLATTPLDAELARVLHMPEDTIIPLALALLTLVLFYGLLLRAWWVAGAAVFGLYIVINIWLWPKGPEPFSEEG
jgi:hypothetical protein